MPPPPGCDSSWSVVKDTPSTRMAVAVQADDETEAAPREAEAPISETELPREQRQQRRQRPQRRVFSRTKTIHVSPFNPVPDGDQLWECECMK